MSTTHRIATTLHTVRDGQRSLQFEGDLLSSSTSRASRYSTRWVEFELYRTVGGQYVLSRIGKSICFHRPTCEVVERNRIAPIPVETLSDNYVPCDDCKPDYDAGEVCPEQPRFWAQTSETAEGVINSLYKYDNHDTRYLTNVAKRLLAEAAGSDDDIRDIFLTEHVA